MKTLSNENCPGMAASFYSNFSALFQNVNIKIAGGHLFLLLFLVLTSQGCKIYHKKTVTVEQSVESNSRVKIIFKDGRKMHFHKIERNDEYIYGIRKIHGEMHKTIIPEKEIKEIHTLNQDASAGASIVVGLGVFVFLMYAIVEVTIGWGF